MRAGHRPSLLLVVAAALGGATLPAPSHAVVRTCGANGVTNTANVLCASPSGPCTATSVRMTTPIEVTNGGCLFDLGGRTLSIERRFEMIGSGFVTVVNAGDITITSAGRIHARGDFVKQAGIIITGGRVTLTSAGLVTHRGVIDVTGDAAGWVDITAAGTVDLDTGSEVKGLGISTWSDDRGRFADGGALRIKSLGGDVVVDGAITMSGQSEAEGGSVAIRAARDIDVNHTIDASGGAENGGSVELSAGDHITIARIVDVSSRGGGGNGGDLAFSAGEDALGGVVTGGTLAVDDGSLNLQGSSGDGFGGDGGTLDARALGAVSVASAVVTRANAGTAFDADGGSVEFSSADSNAASVGVLDGDMFLAGNVLARSGALGGLGGTVAIAAGRHLTVSGDADLGGKDGGGDYAIDVARNVTMLGDVAADATAAGGTGGRIDARTCRVTLASTANFDASGTGGSIRLLGRDQVSVPAASTVHAVGSGASIALVTRTLTGTNPNTGGTLSQFVPTPSIVADPTLPACP